MTNRPDEPFELDDDELDDATRHGGSTRPQMAQRPATRRPAPPPGGSHVRPRGAPPNAYDDEPPHHTRPLTMPEDIPDEDDELPPLPGQQPRRMARPASRPVSPSTPMTSAQSQYAPRQQLPEPNVPRRATQQPRRPKPPVNKRESGLYLPWWSLVIMLIFVAAAALGAWAVVGYLGGDNTPGGTNPIVVVITSTFTVGPPPTPTPIPIAASVTAPANLPTIAPTGTTPPGTFTVGATVKVVGVGIAGLNVRSSPGTEATIKFRANDEELFELREQPQQASGIEWWFIQSPGDPNRSGWAARQFLEVVPPQ